jgi:hypothetical protein
MHTAKQSLRDARDRAGVTNADLISATGLSEAGVLKCFRLNRPPRNPLVRAQFLRLLKLTDRQVGR